MRKIKRLTLLVFFGVVGLGLGFWVLPLLGQLETVHRLKLDLEGVYEKTLEGGLHAWVRDIGLGQEGRSCLALIHGLDQNAMTWEKILLIPEKKWKEMGLVDPLKIFALNLPGSGKSPPAKEKKEDQVRRQAQKLKEALALECPSWLVVGNSYGGWVAAWLAFLWPKGIHRLLLVDSLGLKEMRPPILSWSIPLQAQVDEDALNLVLPKLEVPTLFLWGKEDTVTPLTQGYQMRALLRSAIWREASPCGHWLQLDCPSVVAQSIVDMIHYGSI